MVTAQPFAASDAASSEPMNPPPTTTTEVPSFAAARTAR